MSASANRQRAATGLNTDRLRLSRGVIYAGVSKGGTYSLIYGSQIEFWTGYLTAVCMCMDSKFLMVPTPAIYLRSRAGTTSFLLRPTEEPRSSRAHTSPLSHAMLLFCVSHRGNVRPHPLNI